MRSSAVQQFFQFGSELAAARLGPIAMDNGRKCIHRLAIHEQVELDQFRRAITRMLVIHRGIAATDAFDLVD